MRILITGGLGLVGRHTAALLASHGHQVWLTSRSAEPDVPTWLQRPGIQVISGVTDVSALPDARAAAGADAIVHLAARREPSKDIADFAGTLETTMAVRELAGELDEGGVVVYASTISVYGSAPLPWSPATVAQPLGLYGAVKLAGEQLLLAGSPVRTCALRLGHIFGPDESNGYAVNRFIRSARTGEAMTVHEGATQRREMVYVRDVAQAILVALEHPDAAGVFDVGSGAVHTVGDLAHEAARAHGRPELVTETPAPADSKPGRDSYFAGASASATALPGYAPQWPLRRAMEDVARWSVDVEGARA